MPRKLTLAEPESNCGSCRHWKQGVARGRFGDEGICQRTVVQFEDILNARRRPWRERTSARSFVTALPDVRDVPNKFSAFLVTLAAHACSMWQRKKGRPRQQEKPPEAAPRKRRGPSAWSRLMGKDVL